MFSHKKNVEDIKKNHCLISGCSLFDRITITRNEDIFPLLSTNKRTNNSSFYMQVISKNKEKHEINLLFYFIFDVFIRNRLSLWNFFQKFLTNLGSLLKAVSSFPGLIFLQTFRIKKKGCKN